MCDLRDDSQRLWDLVRHQRAELHVADLITDEEYADLLADGKSRSRLESYDCMRSRIRKLEAANRELKKLNRDLTKAIEEHAHRVFNRWNRGQIEGQERGES